MRASVFAGTSLVASASCRMRWDNNSRGADSSAMSSFARSCAPIASIALWTFPILAIAEYE